MTAASLIARLLSLSWRQTHAPVSVSPEELAVVSPLILGSGAGALGWNRIRRSPAGAYPAALEFQQAYRHHTLEAARHERDIKIVFDLLRANGIEPLLIKGWSIARLYPEKGMRPYDDTDLIVRRAQQSQARAVVERQTLTEFSVDLHDAADEFGYGNEDDLFANSRLVALGGYDIRIPALEDSLRIISVHFLKHGAFRPLWLCDIAALVESMPTDFDWDGCLGTDKRVADWVTCAIGLARRLLGADISDAPIESRAKTLPSWLVPNVLKQWERPLARDHGVGSGRAPLSYYLRRPSTIFGDLTQRWPNPIEATVYMRESFNELPRFPFQIGECLARTARFVAAAVPKAFREAR